FEPVGQGGSADCAFKIALKRGCSVFRQLGASHMSYRILMWVFVAAGLVAIVTAIDLAKERDGGPVFIANKGTIKEGQVRQKMMTDGWTSVLISREGWYFQVMGSKDQQTAHLVVDSQTGRLRGDDDD